MRSGVRFTLSKLRGLLSMNEQEKAQEQAALEFARANKKKIAREITDRQRYLSESSPVSGHQAHRVYVSGSPAPSQVEH